MQYGPLCCEHCGDTYWVNERRRLAVSRFCSVLCRARGINTPEVIAKKVHRGEDHPRFVPVGTRRQWKGMPGVQVKTEQGWEREHRVVAEAPTGMVVHHLDNDPTNNTPANLIVVRQGVHAWLHGSRRDAKGRFMPEDIT